MQQQRDSVVFPGPFAKQQHPDDDDGELRCRTPPGAGCGRCSARPDDQQGEQGHAALDDQAGHARVEIGEVVVLLPTFWLFS
jgi:hypothetical protein